MERCPFGHPNCRGEVIEDGRLVSSGYDRICQLDEPAGFPAGADPIFSGANWAYYVPAAQLAVAEQWWRSHSEGLDFVFHACSGCEDVDHTDWALFSYRYRFPMTKEALLCCHEGPPGCYCELAQQLEDGTGNCLSATETGGVEMRTCSVAPEWARSELGAWKVTYYRPDWAQLETEGYGTFNTNQCLTARACRLGAELLVTPCSGDGLTRMRWEKDRVRVDDCPGLCIDPAHGAHLVPCANLV